MQYQYIRSPGEAEQLAQKLSDEKVLGVDTETTGLDPHKDTVVLLSITSKQGTFLIDTQDPNCLLPFRPLLENEEIAKVGFNLAFDHMMFHGYLGIEMEGCRDLMLAEYVLEAGIQKDGYSLEAITKKYLGKERDKTLQKSFIGHRGDFTEDQLRYAAEDTADLFPLGNKMQEILRSEGLLFTWGIENKSLPAWADTTFYGQKIDVDAWKGVMEFNHLKMLEAKQELDQFFSPFFDRDLFGHLDINYNSQPTLLYGLQKMGIKVDESLIQNTNKETQKKIRNFPVIQALEKYRQAVKAYGTYGQSYLDAIHPKTGRIHPRFNQCATGTGRPSGREGLNVLNIPRDKRFRNAFITDPDRLISTVDFSGAELRIIADQSGDPLMVEGFNSGVDFHCFVAALVFNREKVEKSDPIRTPTKSINFGLAYGMGPGKLFNDLNGMGYKITMQECRDLFQRYKRTFSVAIQWLDKNRAEAREKLVMRNIAGRRRRWFKPNSGKIWAELEAEVKKKHKVTELNPELESLVFRLAKEKEQSQYAAIEREAGNFPVQSTNVEWTKLSMYEIRKQCKEKGYDARMYNSVYDEIVLDIAAKDAPEVHELQKKIMIECGQRFCKKVPVEVEGHLKPHWTK